MFEHDAFGKYLTLRMRGASHAQSLKFSLEHFPAGFPLDEHELAAFMALRAPGCDDLSTSRHEPDEVHFLSGLSNGLTTGEPLVGEILNTDTRPHDYGTERTIPRPGHADFPQWVELGHIPTGGGSNSGRLTALLCAAGGLCKQYLATQKISVVASLTEIGGQASDFESSIRTARAEGDSVGGVITCTVEGLKPGLGGALMGGVESELAAALFGIPGVVGLEFGNGFDAAKRKGSENNDPFICGEMGRVLTTSNRQGGLLGGRTSGSALTFRLALKPTPTIFKPQASVDLATHTPATLTMKGRHDPCIVRRARPVVEAVTAFVLTDLLLARAARTPRICLTLTGTTLAEDLAQYAAARFWTDLVELRIDCLTPSERAQAHTFPARIDVPVICTFRRTSDGGQFEGPDSERLDFFSSVRTAGFRYFDLESDVSLASHPELLPSALATCHIRTIRSRHLFTSAPDSFVLALHALHAHDAHVIPKLAFMPQDYDDVARVFNELKQPLPFPFILCAMGPLGLATRVLSLRIHSFLTFASLGALASLGHLSPHELVRTYRVRNLSLHAQIIPYLKPLPEAQEDVARLNAQFSADDDDALALPIDPSVPGVKALQCALSPSP